MRKNDVALVTGWGGGEDDRVLPSGPGADLVVRELSCVCWECPVMTRLGGRVRRRWKYVLVHRGYGLLPPTSKCSPLSGLSECV